MYVRVVLALLLVVGCLSAVSAEEAAEEGRAVRRTVESSGTVELVVEQAADIIAALNSAEFSLPANIGELIDAARTSADSADTWDVALMLGMAESASGNVSDIVSSAQLIEEGTEKARRNGDSGGLLMAAMANQYAGNEAAYDALLAEYEAAVTDEGATTKRSYYTFDLTVRNRSAHDMKVYVDGNYRGYIHPGWELYVRDVGIGWTTVEGLCPQCGEYWYDEFYGDSWDNWTTTFW